MVVAGLSSPPALFAKPSVVAGAWPWEMWGEAEEGAGISMVARGHRGQWK